MERSRRLPRNPITISRSEGSRDSGSAGTPVCALFRSRSIAKNHINPPQAIVPVLAPASCVSRHRGIMSGEARARGEMAMKLRFVAFLAVLLSLAVLGGAARAHGDKKH